MRHKKRRGKLNRTAAHRSAMFSNMVVSLVQHEQIITTLQKAREARPIMERLITKSRVHTLHTRRQLISKLQNESAVNKLLNVLGPRYANRPGGYVRVLKYKFRAGDQAKMAVLELVDRNVSVKGLGFADQPVGVM